MMNIPASQIRPGDIYQGREVFTVLRRASDDTVRIVVVCPRDLPPIGDYGTGKFTFQGSDTITIERKAS